jgi:hypothetical protein
MLGNTRWTAIRSLAEYFPGRFLAMKGVLHFPILLLCLYYCVAEKRPLFTAFRATVLWYSGKKLRHIGHELLYGGTGVCSVLVYPKAGSRDTRQLEIWSWRSGNPRMVTYWLQLRRFRRNRKSS